MKKWFFLFCFIILSHGYGFNQVVINTDGSTGDESALLDIQSSEKGFLAPRMTENEISGILDPANGLIVYNVDDSKLYVYIGTNGKWKEIAYGTANILPTVTNTTTGEVWMDRNLGASRIAQSSNDTDAKGDLYQWGRLQDGHELINSDLDYTLSDTDVPGHARFIYVNSGPQDWRDPQNNLLWQGLTGINNPCPAGFRIPTSSEWSAERGSWSSNNAAGAYGSVLKLTVGGYRASTGSIGHPDIGYYWSSTIYGTQAYFLSFNAGNGGNYNNKNRGDGMSIRCIKD